MQSGIPITDTEEKPLTRHELKELTLFELNKLKDKLANNSNESVKTYCALVENVVKMKKRKIANLRVVCASCITKELQLSLHLETRTLEELETIIQETLNKYMHTLIAEYYKECIDRIKTNGNIEIKLTEIRGCIDTAVETINQSMQIVMSELIEHDDEAAADIKAYPYTFTFSRQHITGELRDKLKKIIHAREILGDEPEDQKSLDMMLRLAIESPDLFNSWYDATTRAENFLQDETIHSLFNRYIGKFDLTRGDRAQEKIQTYVDEISRHVTQSQKTASNSRDELTQNSYRTIAILAGITHRTEKLKQLIQQVEQAYVIDKQRESVKETIKLNHTLNNRLKMGSIVFDVEQGIEELAQLCSNDANERGTIESYRKQFKKLLDTSSPDAAISPIHSLKCRIDLDIPSAKERKLAAEIKKAKSLAKALSTLDDPRFKPYHCGAVLEIIETCPQSELTLFMLTGYINPIMAYIQCAIEKNLIDAEKLLESKSELSKCNKLLWLQTKKMILYNPPDSEASIKEIIKQRCDKGGMYRATLYYISIDDKFSVLKYKDLQTEAERGEYDLVILKRKMALLDLTEQFVKECAGIKQVELSSKCASP